MADFPPNLDDGELWIPSDILVSDIPAPSKTASPPPPPPPPPLHFPSTPDLSVDVHLARHFTCLSSSQLQRFGPANQYGLTASPPPPYGPPPTPPTTVFAFGSGSAFFSPGPVLYYQVQVFQPAQGVAASVHPPQTRFSFQNGISRPESGGTGVFIPRATEDGGRRKQVLRNRSRAVSTGQNQRIGQASTRRVEMSKSEGWWCHGHGSIPTAATALPGDWTY